MKTLLTAAAAALLLLTGCGSDGSGPTVASDPAGETPAVPTTVPAADGTVHTAALATVMDTGSPELCLGAVAESYPPQCTGPAIVGWDWADHERMFERQGPATWGSFAVTGQWDGETFTYESAVPAALYDPMVQEPATYPTPAVELTEAELVEIQDGLDETLPGYQSSYPDGAGHLVVDVVYDDGSLQDWLDAEHGEDVVVLHPLLVDQGA
ncbi:hypothetical protein GON03_16760 [Nocardioides sp. MAH-18]|uniref:DUF3558 domain-containing protein n=1 Tax=Nocardioides agri TaxID=2682843 RepID=A0A6L6XUH4_9ACTN|nr:MULTISPECIES: hypothetical protein [unclassified Nocardioides]MBA2955991.1 hypothetical protein [Nocardioides sp. CGMCC 1.13656]MVQ50839.1 hypothetical protein [Nocardioides sp. MAH-18]